MCIVGASVPRLAHRDAVNEGCPEVSARVCFGRLAPMPMPGVGPSPRQGFEMRSIRRKALASGACLAVLAGLAAGQVSATQAVATGPETTYLVLTPEGSTAKAEARVSAAGGIVVANYGQIGVLVARSTNAAFETSVAGSGVQAVASTAGLGSALDDDEVIGTVESTTA